MTDPVAVVRKGPRFMFHRRTAALAVAWLAAVAAPALPLSVPTRCCTATIRAAVPAGTGKVYLSGNLPELGPWRADARLMAGTGRERSVRITVPPGTALEYKFTLGRWDREALNAAGAVPANYQLTPTRDTTVTHTVAAFKLDQRKYIADWRGSGVLGRLIYWTDVRSEHLGPTRHVEIWLPPGYDSSTTTRYPVLTCTTDRTSSTRASRTPAWTGAWTKR